MIFLWKLKTPLADPYVLKQVSNWFINARVRLWKPMVEEMYLEEVKDPENNIASSEGATDQDNDINPNNVQYPPPPLSSRSEDQKPSLVRIDSECASSIINNHSTPDNKNDPKGQEQCFGSVESWSHNPKINHKKHFLGILLIFLFSRSSLGSL